MDKRVADRNPAAEVGINFTAQYYLWGYMNADDLLRLTRKPQEPINASDETQTCDLIALLQAQKQDGRVALYASATHGMSSILVHSVLVDTAKLSGDLTRIVDWEGNPYDAPGCALVTSGSQEAWVEMTHPWLERQPDPLHGATQLVFARSFGARLGDSTYFELSHQLSLPHGLHWLEEKQGWCKYDERGEVVASAGVERAGNDEHGASANLVWIDYDLLQRHMSRRASR